MERIIDDPRGAYVDYEPAFLTAFEATRALTALEELREVFSTDPLVMYGRTVPSPRLTIALSDQGVRYQYSGTSQSTLPWPKPIADVRSSVEALVGHDFTHALINLYRDGRDYIGWHSDSRTGMQPGSTIACVSLGATRTFQLRDRTGGPITDIDLTHASLIIMGGRCQDLYRHSVPRRATTHEPRYSLTLRQLLPVPPEET